MREMSMDTGGVIAAVPTNPPHINKRWFQNLFADKKMKQSEVAKAIGLHAPALTRILNDERRLQMNEAIDLARVLSIPLEDVLTHAGLPSHAESSSAEVRGSINEEGLVEYATARVRSVDAPGEGLSALEYPKHRWTLYYRPSASVSPDAIGRLAMVILARDGHTAKQPCMAFVERGSRPGVYDLRGFVDGQETRDVTLGSASPVVWIRT